MAQHPSLLELHALGKQGFPILWREAGTPGLEAPLGQSAPGVLFSVVDLASADLEEVAQKSGLSYKVSFTLGLRRSEGGGGVRAVRPVPLEGSLPAGLLWSLVSGPLAGPGCPEAGAAGPVLSFPHQRR